MEVVEKVVVERVGEAVVEDVEDERGRLLEKFDLLLLLFLIVRVFETLRNG